MSVDYLYAKVAAAVGGFFGGSAILTYIRPKTISEAFTRGATSVGSAVVFSAPLLRFAGIEDTWETQLMAGFCVGFIAYSLLGMIANFLSKNHDKDIKEVYDDLRDKK